MSRSSKRWHGLFSTGGLQGVLLMKIPRVSVSGEDRTPLKKMGDEGVFLRACLTIYGVCDPGPSRRCVRGGRI